MKHYESYVAESKARRRRQLAVGLVGAVMLATLAVTALMVLSPPAVARAVSGSSAS
jgi:peptidoglycan biosynthesis protein MviN/MurJ (putative lipid II flippase)